MWVVSISPCWKLTPVWCSASFGELDASLLVHRKALHSLSHPSLCLKIPLVWLALMLAAHWQTDWLVWEKEEGKRGRGWMEKKSPSSDWQAGRTDGAQFFQAFSGGAVSSPFQHLLSPPPLWVSGAPRLGPLDSLALYSASFQTQKKKNPPPPNYDEGALLCSVPRWKSKSAPMHLEGLTCGTGRRIALRGSSWNVRILHKNVTAKL